MGSVKNTFSQSDCRILKTTTFQEDEINQSGILYVDRDSEKVNNDFNPSRSSPGRREKN